MTCESARTLIDNAIPCWYEYAAVVRTSAPQVGDVEVEMLPGFTSTLKEDSDDADEGEGGVNLGVNGYNELGGGTYKLGQIKQLIEARLSQGYKVACIIAVKLSIHPESDQVATMNILHHSASGAPDAVVKIFRIQNNIYPAGHFFILVSQPSTQPVLFGAQGLGVVGILLDEAIW